MANGLTNKQQVFIDEYLKTWNAAEAARRAGYSVKTAKEMGAENLTKPNIAAEIKQRIDQLKMESDEVLIRLADHARGDLSHFIRPSYDSVVVDLTTDAAKEKIHLLKKIKQTKKRGTRRDGEEWQEEHLEIELHDPQAALVHIGRHHKLFTDKHEHAGPDGKALIIQYVNDWRGDEGDE